MITAQARNKVTGTQFPVSVVTIGGKQQLHFYMSKGGDPMVLDPDEWEVYDDKIDWIFVGKGVAAMAIIPTGAYYWFKLIIEWWPV